MTFKRPWRQRWGRTNENNETIYSQSVLTQPLEPEPNLSWRHWLASTRSPDHPTDTINTETEVLYTELNEDRQNAVKSTGPNKTAVFTLKNKNNWLFGKHTETITRIYRHVLIHSFHFYPRDAMLARVIEIATCPSVCLSVRHAPVLCQNEES